MNPAPIIGLSATVGAPERFSAWLESVETSCGRKYSLVQQYVLLLLGPYRSTLTSSLHSHHRFNALRKFAYAPQFPVKPIGTLNEHKPKPGVFAPVHPIAALALGDPNLPEDLALEPRDTLSLWQAMSAVSTLDPALTPKTYFAKTPAIAIKDVIEYEKELKQVLVSWREAPDSNDPESPFQKVVKAIESPLRAALEESEQAIEEGTEDDFNGLFLPLLADLNAQGSLPAIIFNFSRDKVRISLGFCRVLDEYSLADPCVRSGRGARSTHLGGPRGGRDALEGQQPGVQAQSSEGKGERKAGGEEGQGTRVGVTQQEGRR
jgi:hypothetical protein